ncbi:hypothetical protein OPW33_13110 [Vibrio europaeus]|uniref:hypothetical protein n=1 Tax=Vibrio europaeus TaxID=300876 RepID=UPI00233FF6C6|nr:hypothetical protein [Vibrio europaeus]MDC5840263.1 hypothetical protein [Vibrio europaeus]
MNKEISERLFRSLGTHALKAFSLSERGLTLVVAPWENLEDEAVAVFSELEVCYIEADSGTQDFSTDFNLPWDIIRFDSYQIEDNLWEFGLCCSEIKVGFKSKMPEISFSSK